MNCKGWEERIALSAGGDPDPAADAELSQHLAECAACRAFAAEIEDTLALVRAAHQEPIAAGHYTALRSRVLDCLERERRPWRRWWWAVGPAVVAAGAMAALFLARPVEKAKAPVAALPQPARVVAGRDGGDAGLAPPVAEGRGAVPRTAAVRKPPPVVSSTASEAPAESGGSESAALAEPLVVKLFTNDPNVVIYWIADRKGDAQ